MKLPGGWEVGGNTTVTCLPSVVGATHQPEIDLFELQPKSSYGVLAVVGSQASTLG